MRASVINSSTMKTPKNIFGVLQRVMEFIKLDEDKKLIGEERPIYP